MNRGPQSVQSVPKSQTGGSPYTCWIEPSPPSSHTPLLTMILPLWTHVSKHH